MHTDPLAEAVARVEALGGKIELGAGASAGQVVAVTLSHCDVTDEDMAFIARFTALARLALDHTRIGDSGVAHLANLASLGDLNLQHTRFTDDGLRHLSAMKALGDLNISDNRITDAGLKHLAGITTLYFVDADDTWITADGAKALGSVAVMVPNAKAKRFRDPGSPHRQHKIEGIPGTMKDAPWARIDLSRNSADDARWHGFAPETGMANPNELTELPELGKFYAIRSAGDFSIDTEFPSWILFVPYPASEEGLHAYPEQLAHSAIVQCVRVDLDDVPPKMNAVVEVLDVIPLRDIAKRFDARTDTPADRSLLTCEPSPRTGYYWCGDLCFIYLNFEGDVVVWAVCQRTPAEDLLLLYSGWGSDWCYLGAGHRPLTAGESARYLPRR